MFEGLFNSFIKSRAGQSILSMGDTGSHSFGRELIGKVLNYTAAIGKSLYEVGLISNLESSWDDDFMDTSAGMKWSCNFIVGAGNKSGQGVVNFIFEIKDGNTDNAYFTCKIGEDIIRQIPANVKSLDLRAANSLISDIRSFYG